tara:strand:+ start:12420 stop:13613 length:1194 start_codon:yes stop_codon:yes gene_type:complete
MIFFIITFISFLFADGPVLSSQIVARGLDSPVYLTAPEGERDTLYVLEQGGRVKKIGSGKLIKKPFIDISDRVHNPVFPGDERGLLGMAFHPNFYNNGFLFLNYVSKNQHTIISRFSVRGPNPLKDSEFVLIDLVQPYMNHNGGQLAFGPDGYLYIGVGDGGSAGDPENNGQNKNSLFGTVLRIDVDSGDPYKIPKSNPFVNIKNSLGEIWLIGLRNPWRFSFDFLTNEIYIGDVGQSRWEEIHVLSMDDGGSNLGWSVLEGSSCYSPEKDCDTSGLVLPVFEYPNDANYMKTLIGFSQNKPEVQGCSVTGGYVYRGETIPKFQGHYIFADYCTGKFWSFVYKNGVVTKLTNRTNELRKGTGKKQLYVSSFGQDGLGELYFLDYDGDVYKILESTVD